ncbi:(R)-mandelonitrile lyase [Pedobacter agri]|uniref:(R)-mandelonitrile lyase n=1 Tax=Pedobacter agri TaxID=454586 RepID=UPI00292FAD2A|nr:cupin domain-containing protein [Pedobacter agri]
MRKYLTLIAISALLMGCGDNKHSMKTQEIFPKGNPLPQEWFTGKTFITPLVAKDENNNFSAGSITFEPAARTHWHTHPRGQVLIVIAGEGFYQQKGKPAQVIKKGDVVNIPENTEHWHGANVSGEMTHIAITNYQGEDQVTWLKPVTDGEYKLAIDEK